MIFRRILSLTALLLLPACAMPSGGGAENAGSADTTPRAADGRKRDDAKVKEAVDALQKAVDAYEAEVMKTFQVALGKEAATKNAGKTPAADLITLFRTKKVKLQFRKPVHSRHEAFMLDEYAMNNWDSGPGKGKRDESRELRKQYEELDFKIRTAHELVDKTNHDLLDFNMTIMLLTSKIVAERHKAGYEPDDVDLGVVAAFISAQRRCEQISALSTGLLTAYQGVIKDNKDPKAIPAYVEEASKAFPTTATATVDDAKAYIQSLKQDGKSAKERYVQWMKDIHGEEEYGAYKRGVDEKFAQISENLSVEMGTRAGPAGGGGTAGGAPPAGGTNAALQKGLGAAARGDVGGMAAAAVDLLPIDGKAKAAVAGAVALARGDFKGALNAATSIVPDGPIKKGLSILGSFLG